jgi:uncharacterized protein
LSAGTRDSLDRRLEDYQKRTGHQILVWIGRTTGEVPIEDFAVRAFAAWKVGRKGLDDGIVLFVLADDRQVRIEVGYGLEGQVPDAIASRIIGVTIAPRIKAGDRDGALVAGVDALIAAIDKEAPETKVGQPSPERPAPPEAPKSLSIVKIVLIGLAVLAFVILFITHPSLAIYLLFSILSGGRGGGGYSGGGGFSGGGGGSGGGGASGRW